MKNDRTRRRLRRVGVYAVLVVLAIPLVLPMWWMVASSLKQPADIFAYPPALIPRSFRLQNYVDVFTLAPFAQQFFNSLYIGVLVTFGTIFTSAIAGYAFARIRFPGRNFLFLLLLSALLMPAEVTIIPLFVVMRQIGWLGTHLPVIIEPMFGAQAIVGTFLMRQYFLALPIELEDAGRIDGLGRFGLFRHIAMPLALPALATLAILTFLSSWNAFLEPLIFLGGDNNVWTIPIALTQYADRQGAPIWNVQLAATTISVIPMVVVFLLAQRHFIQGFARAGING